MLTLLTMLALPTFAQDSAPEGDAVRVERMTEKLGVAPAVAEELIAIVRAHKETLADHKAEVVETARGLRQAREDGDDKAMKRAMDDLRRLRDQGRKTQDRHHDELMSLLTVDQQATWVLMGLHRKAKRHQTDGLPRQPR
ncbi:MAG: hypothetical protein AAF211_13895 [Myxococcota bacterium]